MPVALAKSHSYNMAKITEEDMFEGSYSSRGDDTDVADVPTLDELQANMKAARQQSLASIPVEPMAFPSKKEVFAAIQRRQQAEQLHQEADEADAILDEMTQEEAEATQLSEAEVKLEKANCYKVLLQDSMFEDYSPATAEVEAEIRAFILKRLRVLMGIEQEASATSSGAFSKEEVSALKHLASRVISKNPQAAQAQMAQPKKEEKVQPKLRVRSSAPEQREAPAPTKRPVSNLAKVPEKVKPVRKQKETVTIALPNGHVVETENTPPPKRSLQDLQDIADQARISAERDIHLANSNRTIDSILRSK